MRLLRSHTVVLGPVMLAMLTLVGTAPRAGLLFHHHAGGEHSHYHLGAEPVHQPAAEYHHHDRPAVRVEHAHHAGHEDAAANSKRDWRGGPIMPGKPSGQNPVDGVNDVNFTPGNPFNVRGGVSVYF